MHVAIVGGGLAGLACAAGLGRAGGVRVTLLESKSSIGGRAGSFTDPATGELVDACQHVAMGCCTNFLHFCRDAGLGDWLAPQPRLSFMTPDRRVSRFQADRWPAPFHLSRALLAAHYLSPVEKLRIGYGLSQLLKLDPSHDEPLDPWLRSHAQTDRTISRFWSITLTSALNESTERVGTKYARKVFADGFISHRDAWKVWIPTVPLGELYGPKLTGYLASLNVNIETNAAVRSVSFDGTPTARFRDGRTITADRIVLAVPFGRVFDLLPASFRQEPFFSPVHELTPSPITSVHLWTDRPFTSLPHIVFVDSPCQWGFARTLTNGESYFQVVVSASRELKSLGRDEIARRIMNELRSLFPDFRHAQLLRSKVVTEHAATFSAVPHVDRLRPPQETPVPGLTLAGDWTRTGWPATMEGAVISGYRAAEVVLRSVGRPAGIVRPPLA
jgi:squalene-associated FAD-dependent desaturase